MATGRSEDSRFVRITRARTVSARFGSPLVYELDGGEREATTRLKAKAVPGALTVCLPHASESS
jgi:hypothetical protein